MPGGQLALWHDAPHAPVAERRTPKLRTCARLAQTLRTAAITECAFDGIFVCAAEPQWLSPLKVYAKPSGCAGNVFPHARLRDSATAAGVQDSTIPAHFSPTAGRGREHGQRLPWDYGGWGRSRLPGDTLRAEPMKRLLASRRSTFGSTRTISPTRGWEENPLTRNLLQWCIPECEGLQ